MSDASVITNEDGGLKKDYCDSLLRPKFAIMNPERTFTLPEWQTACGATDIMMHTMERYFSNDDDMEVTNVVAEAILKIVMEHAPIVLAEPENYHSRAQIMWAGSLAHNDLTGCGNGGDWATHNIEHELSGMFDVSHGAGLAAIWPSWARYTRHQNINRFARFAVNVMGVTNHFKSAEETAEAGIRAMEKFYTSIGMPINIKQLVGRNVTDAEIEEMADKCTNGNTMTVGGLIKLTKEDIINIYKLANE
jgi:alcohol dehydrogenase YqhD (iron-dependent ADH family)